MIQILKDFAFGLLPPIGDDCNYKYVIILHDIIIKTD